MDITTITVKQLYRFLWKLFAAGVLFCLSLTPFVLLVVILASVWIGIVDRSMHH